MKLLTGDPERDYEKTLTRFEERLAKEHAGTMRSVDENGDESGLRVEILLIVHHSRRRSRRPKSHRRERGNASEVRSHVRFRPYRPGIRWVIPGPEGPGFVL